MGRYRQRTKGPKRATAATREAKSSESLMAHLKNAIRARRLAELIEADARVSRTEGKAPEPKTIDNVPMPTDFDAWTEYETAKDQYSHDLDEYKRVRKEALEIFPQENRKVFSALIKCISDASVQDLKRTPEGAQLYSNHDSYGFFKLAIQEHEYLPPAISSAAVARAKEDFEKYRQKAEDSLTEHINEFRRRYEALLKVRGPEGGSPYMDFDLKYLLINSSHKPTSGPWIASREATDTMPVGFEALVLALKKAESTMILKGTSAMDLHMPTAHATKGDRRLEPTTPATPLPPSKCSVCGTTFCPKRSTHVRCDTCQDKFVARRRVKAAEARRVNLKQLLLTRKRTLPTQKTKQRVSRKNLAMTKGVPQITLVSRVSARRGAQPRPIPAWCISTTAPILTSSRRKSWPSKFAPKRSQPG